MDGFSVVVAPLSDGGGSVLDRGGDRGTYLGTRLKK